MKKSDESEWLTVTGWVTVMSLNGLCGNVQCRNNRVRNSNNLSHRSCTDCDD